MISPVLESLFAKKQSLVYYPSLEADYFLLQLKVCSSPCANSAETFLVDVARGFAFLAPRKRFRESQNAAG